MSNFRKDRLESDIQIYLNQVKLNEIDEKLVHDSTITYVKLSTDFSIVKVYIDYYDQSKLDEIVKLYRAQKITFRNFLAEKLKLKRVPDLMFEIDKSIAEFAKIDDLLNKIQKKE